MMFFNTWRRVIARTLIVTTTAVTLQPLTAAAQAKSAATSSDSLITQSRSTTPAQSTAKFQGPTEKYSRQLADLEETLKSAAPQAFDTGRAAPAPDEVKRKTKQLRTQNQQLIALETEVEAGFDNIGQSLKDKNLPVEIQDRHRAAVTEYQARKAEYKRLMKAVEKADDDGRDVQAPVVALAGFMGKYPNGKRHTPTDPNKLPWGTPKPAKREPITTEQGFKTSLFKSKPIHLAAAGTISGLGFPSATLPSIPTSEDLGETEDVQLTPAIRAKAQELQNQPVLIYNWVRNNIEFLPTYGSIQGADLTLTTKRGNAFDTANLLIALYRAAGIPARYVYGTVEMPTDKVMNWVGGATTPGVVQNLLSQGGIPNVGLAEGGQIKRFRIEHVWVEAWVDYYPSRGAKNRQGDTWVPLDASFKQYQYVAGMDIKTQVPFDAAAFLIQAQLGATVNATEGWVQSLNQGNIQSGLGAYQNQVQSYINSQKANATVGDVLGTKTIVQQNHPILDGTLPYPTVAIGAKLQRLPDTLRHTATIKLFYDETDRSQGSAALSYTIDLPSLNSKRIGISYQPVSAVDAQLIQSYKDQGASELPAYLIRLIPVIQLDGAAVATGAAIGMGLTQLYEVTLKAPQGLNSVPTLFLGSVGDEIVFGINGNGISPEVAQARADSISPSSSAAENLHQIALIFWIEHDLFDSIAAKNHGVVRQRMPSVGLFSAPLAVGLFFGIPRSANYKGRVADVKRNLQVAAAADSQAVVNYLSQVGMQGSYLEGSVPEQLLHTQQGKAVSATQLLMDAAQQGIPIYTINRANVGVALPQLQVSQNVKDDIGNAVAAGLIAIVPQRQAVHGTYSGVGYIVQNPQTGEGAYLIDGGMNGMALAACASTLAPAVGTVFLGIVLSAILIMSVPETVTASVTIAAVQAGFTGANLAIITTLAVAFIASTAKAVDSIGKTFKQSFSDFDDCSCSEHFARCVQSGWDRSLPSYGGNLCKKCMDICTFNGGNSSGNWPDGLPTFPGGPVDVNLSCNYPGR